MRTKPWPQGRVGSTPTPGTLSNWGPPGSLRQVRAAELDEVGEGELAGVAEGSIGLKPPEALRNESGSRFNIRTNVSATMRPPSSPRLSPLRWTTASRRT